MIRTLNSVGKVARGLMDMTFQRPLTRFVCGTCKGKDKGGTCTVSKSLALIIPRASNKTRTEPIPILPSYYAEMSMYLPNARRLIRRKNGGGNTLTMLNTTHHVRLTLYPCVVSHFLNSLLSLVGAFYKALKVVEIVLSAEHLLLSSIYIGSSRTAAFNRGGN